MINLKKEKTIDQTLSMEKRLTTSEEVALGYNDREAMEEATRCLNCPTKPCMAGCPLHNNVPAFIKSIVDNKLDEGMAIISQTSPLPFVCSRVCNQAKQCEGNCTRGKNGMPVAIGKLERYICDKEFAKLPPLTSVQPTNGKTVAIVGSGPSGLACGEELARNGYKVTIYEKLPFIGGLLIYGIPEFRLPHSLVNNKIDSLKKLGINFVLNCSLGNDITLDDLEKQYDYVYLAFGADIAKSMHIENENIPGVYKSNEYLLLMEEKDINNPLYQKFITSKDVIVTGGGNVAMDCARVARRTGANVTIVYRRSLAEMPCKPDELQDALDEGIEIKYLTNPIKVNGSDHVTSVTVVDMVLGEPDASGRRCPIVVEGSEHVIKCDALIYAIGSNSDLSLLSTLGLDYESWGGIKVDENYVTSHPHVYAGGDLITGPNYVVHAVRDGIKVAKHIISQNVSLAK